MLQAANTNLFNPFVPRAHNSVSKSTISYLYFIYKLSR